MFNKRPFLASVARAIMAVAFNAHQAREVIRREAAPKIAPDDAGRKTFKSRNGAWTTGYYKPDRRTRRFKWGQFGKKPRWAK